MADLARTTTTFAEVAQAQQVRATILDCIAAHRVSAEQTFRAFDANHSDSISWKEMAQGIRKLRLQLDFDVDEGAARSLLRVFDLDSDGRVGLSDFLGYLAECRASSSNGWLSGAE